MCAIELKDKERIDDLQCDGLKIIQNPEKFCFGIDAVLLSGWAKITPGSRVLDLGTGTGVIPILLSAKTRNTKFVALDIQEESCDMAGRSVALNGLVDRIEVLRGDIKEVAVTFAKGSFDAVVSNPPYMVNNHGLKNESDAKMIARHEVLCNLEDVIMAAASVLKEGGTFSMVHRPFRLAEIMVMLTRYKLEPKRLRMVHSYMDKEPSMILIEARKGGRSNLIIEKPLIVYKEQGVYTDEIHSIYGTLDPGGSV